MKSGIQGVSQPKIIKLNPKQSAFIHSKARFRAFFGGICSGKSTTACLLGIDFCLRYPGCIGVVIRNTSPELEMSTKKIFLDHLKLLDSGKPYGQKVIHSINNNENWVKFTNGSIVFFKHTSDEGLYRGPEFGWFLIDQAEELDEKIVELIIERLRQPGMPQVGMFVGNTDRGHNWCYRWFKKGELKNCELIETTTFDNLVFFEETNNMAYLESLLQRPPEWQRVKLYGKWEAISGQIVQLEPYHILPKFIVPDSWYKFVAIDPAGSTGITGALGFVRDPHGSWIIYNEYYGKNRIVKEHAEGIKKLWGGMDKVHMVFMDPSAWRKEQGAGDTFTTLVDRYREYGIYPVPAENSITIGIDLIVEKLRPDPEHKHPLTGQRGAPKLFFVKENLPNLFEELMQWSYDDPQREPVHCVDALRYSVASNPPKPEIRIESDEEIEDYSFMAV